MCARLPRVLVYKMTVGIFILTFTKDETLCDEGAMFTHTGLNIYVC